MRPASRITALGVAALAWWVLSLPASYADDSPYSPIDRPGPALTHPTADLAASLTCTAGVTNARRSPVLLLEGLHSNTNVNFAWNYGRALTKAGIPWCASNIRTSKAAFNNTEDIQTRGEYVTYAIRAMHTRAHRKVSVLAWSVGALPIRWALRFWPDTRTMVDDVIGLAPSNHGTAAVNALCALPCAPAAWQQRPASRFLAALDSGQETFATISYTSIRTEFDEATFPASRSILSGPGSIANHRVQDLCPGHVADHLMLGSTDPVGEAFVMDALAHPGPAQIGRLDRSVCRRLLMSGVDPLRLPANLATMLVSLAASAASSPSVRQEPALRCYPTALGC